MTIIAIVIVVLCSAWTLLGIVAVIRATRGQRLPESVASEDVLRIGKTPVGRAISERAGRALGLPPVSILKPLCGADAGLADNLESFFRQDYPCFELVFGVQNPDDPAIAVVESLKARFPQVSVKLVVHSGARAINPKVDNLLGMLPKAEFDLVLISDSNVRAPSHYLAEMVDTLLASPKNGLVTNLFAGTGEDGLGSALENVQLNGFCAAGAALPTLLGDSLVVGKSMLFSRSTFESLGGFRRVADVLAEDYVMGKMFQHGGYRVRIAPSVLDNVTRGMSVKGFFDRQLRWAMLRSRLRPAAQLLEVLSSPLAVLPVACWLMGTAEGLTWTFTLLALRDVGGWVALRGWRRAWVPMLLSPARELAMLVVWARAPLKRHVMWRGHKVRLGAGTLVFAPAEARAH
ncbi:MAG: glycosyltransferase [Polyangiaceae bacterium]